MDNIILGSNIECLNNGLNTPLLLAAACGHDETVNLLLERGADSAIRNMKDRDALWMAVLYGHRSKGLSRVIDSLCRKDIAVNHQDSSGCTPLHECASRNLSRPVQLLVDNGAGAVLLF